MPKIGDLVSKLQVGNKTFKNPEWWSTQHKLKKDAKLAELLKVKIDIAEFSVNKSVQELADVTTNNMLANLDMFKYREFAPWSNIFKKTKSIILFKK